MRRVALLAVLLLAGNGVVPLSMKAEASPALLPSPVRSAAAGIGASPDFDGDGHADLAMTGMHYARDANLPHWVVSVVYGSRRGLSAKRNQVWRQLDFPDEAKTFRLAADTAAGDFDGDGYSDLAVGTYPADPEVVPMTGAVRILYGSPAGLQRGRTQHWTSASPGLPPLDGSDDQSFGTSLIAANFGRSGHADLAIGAPERDDGGAVTVLYGSRSGLSAQGSQLWSQATPGIPGVPDGTDAFGTSLAAGPFAGSTYADLAVGVPGDGRTTEHDGLGAVNIIYGSAVGLTARGSQLWSQGSRGIKGKPVGGEQFGSTLVAGHFAGRATADLAIGVFAATDAREYGGAINVLYGTRTGLSAKGDQLWTPGSKGMAGKKYLDTFFSSSLTAGNFGRDRGARRYDDLAIGASTDFSVDGLGGSMGAVEVLYGSGKGLTAAKSQIWRWDSPGVKGNPPFDQDSYGDVLIAAEFGNGPAGRAYDDLAAGDSLFPSSSQTYGAVSVLAGSRTGLTARGDQLWTVPKLKRHGPSFLFE